MDAADSFELHHMISFQVTRSAWTFTRRLSSYHHAGTNTNAKTAVFEVRLAGTGSKDVKVPAKAVLKISSHAAGSKTDLMSVETAKEIRALDQLTVTFCRHAPTLIDAKVVLLDESADGSKGYVTYWLTSFVEGVSLKDGLFWTFPQAKRDVVRRAFQATLSDIHACWVTIPSKPCNLLVDDVEGRVYITSFRNSDTYNQFNADKFKHVLDPYYTHWRNSWFADWGLTSSEISDGESYDDGSCFSEFACAYTAGSGDDSRVFPKRDIIKVLGSRVEVDDAVVASGDKREKKGVFYALRKVLQRA